MEKENGTTPPTTGFPDDSKQRTVPLSPTGVPTTTLTQRPWTVYITLGVCIVCAVTLGVIHGLGHYTTSQTTLDRLIRTLTEGDVDALMEDPELGFRDRAQKDVRQRGLEEYNKIMAAFSTCSTAGLERYRSLKQMVLLRGEEAFKKLPFDKQKELRQKSRDEWILSRGLEGLGPEAVAGIDDPAVFTDPKAAEPFLLKLGHEKLSASPEEELPPLAEVQTWASRPAKALGKPQKETLARVRSAGEAALSELEDKVLATGTKLFKALPARERKSITSLSRDMWVIQSGIDQLDEEDRMLVSGPEMFLADADEEKQARDLCLLILPPAKKALLMGRNYEDFTAKREEYISSTGRERYVHFLSVLFAGCEYEVLQTTLSGDDPFDLFRISRATYRINWKGCPGAAEYLGETLTFQFDGRTWRYQPRPLAREGQTEPAPVPPTAQPQNGGAP